MPRTVTTRTTRKEQRSAGQFPFTKDMIPTFDGSNPYVKNYKENAWQTFHNLSMPTTKDEPWRRTDIRRLDSGSFNLPVNGRAEGLTQVPIQLTQPLLGDHHAGQIILKAGGSVEELDRHLVDQGVIFSDLNTAVQNHPEQIEKSLGQIVKADEGKFAALAATFAESGVFVYVPKGVKVEQPLHSVLWGPGSNLAYFSHIIVWLEEGADLTYVHEAASPTEADGQTLHAGLVEIHVGPGATLRFVELQSWGEHVWNFAHKRARVERDGNLDWVFVAVGSHLTKDFSDLDLIGEGSNGRMSGFFFTDGNQHLDHDTQQNHMAANTTSDLLFKGALMGKSRSVWQGMIYVAPGAQKTDGYQANRNLILSNKARADSIPGLEIMADDVRCTHGATVGKIDQEELFYIRSRGIKESEAEKLIVKGFFEPIMQRIPFEGVQNRLNNIIAKKMG